LRFSPDSRWLAMNGPEQSICLIDLHADNPGSTARFLLGHSGTVMGAVFSADVRWLTTYHKYYDQRGNQRPDHTIRVWNLGAKDPSLQPKVLPQLRIFETSLDGRLLVGADEERTWLVDLAAGERPIMDLNAPDEIPV